MAIIKNGSFTVTTGGAAQNLGLGFIPSRFTMWNQTKIQATPVAQISQVMWLPQLANASAWVWTSTVTTGVQSLALITSGGITPYQTGDASLYAPSNLTITGISQAHQAVITAANSFTTKDYGITKVTFHGVKGMTQINTLTGTVVSASGGTSFTVNIDTSAFTTYSSGGIANIITGIPALQGGLITSGNAPGFPPAQTDTTQVLNTALYNAGTIGLTLGASILANTSDVWLYEAVLDCPFLS